MSEFCKSEGLTADDFKMIAAGGFGDRWNAYAHSMAWFRNELYIGITRANMCMLKATSPDVKLAFWPIKCPDDIYEIDRRVEIMAYNPETGRWLRAYKAPLIIGSTGEEVTRDIGYRAMAVFQSRSDKDPALYVATWSPSKAKDPLIMRTRDGIDFSLLPAPRLENSSVNTFRNLVPCNGKLYTAPTGQKVKGGIGMQNVSETPVVFGTADPENEPWMPVSPFGFDDPTNLSIFAMSSFNGYLYAGTFNPSSGYQIWKAKPVDEPPYEWTKVISNGAFRGPNNEMVVSMHVFNDSLYIGGGIQRGGYDWQNKIGPAGAEIIRIHPDDSWDLIVGRPRSTPQGFKSSLSGFGPGFDNVFNGYIWSMAVHEGWLYVGTQNWAIDLPYTEWQLWNKNVVKGICSIGFEKILEDKAGFNLWRTQDGINWVTVTRNGFDNIFNRGIRTMVSTPTHLFVGTANLYGPEVGVLTTKGWEYTENSKGGLEVWMGAKRSRDGREQVEELREISEKGLSDSDSDFHEDKPLLVHMESEYYGHSNFRSYGYWYPDTDNQKKACENLIEKLLNLLPSKNGTILDASFGSSESLKLILRYYKPSSVITVFNSTIDLQRCALNIRDCTFLLMNNGIIPVTPNSVDSIICVEPTFHFRSSKAFLLEAFRVLKPGGNLVMSDVYDTNPSNVVPLEGKQQSMVSSIDDYRVTCLKAEFIPLDLIDATSQCWESFYRNRISYLREKLKAYHINKDDFKMMMDLIYRGIASGRSYFLISVKKTYQ